MNASQAMWSGTTSGSLSFSMTLSRRAPEVACSVFVIQETSIFAR